MLFMMRSPFWALILATSLYHSCQVQSLSIKTPLSGEVIDVDNLYTLTWTVDGLGLNDKVETILIGQPDYAPLTSESNYYYLQGFGDDAEFNISAAGGSYGLNLTRWWSPIYNELPSGMWNISLTISDAWKASTRRNDTVQVYLTSTKTYQRPVLPPIQNFTSKALGLALQRSKPASGTWRVVLSTIIPFMLISIIGWLCRRRQTHHKYSSISRDPVQAAETQSKLSQPTVPAVSPSEKGGTSHTESGRRHSRVPFLFLLSAFITLVPLVGLLIALLTLLLQYRVQPATHSRPDFISNTSTTDSTVFYVDYDATRYTTVASWTSSISLLLPGFLTTLIWYRQSQRLEHDTITADLHSLLTPYQLSLLLNLKSGTIGSLWDYLLYICSRRREKQARFLFDAGFVVLISTLLGLGIWVADTWLHVTTSTVPFSRVHTATPASSWSYGRQLWQNCSSDPLHSSQLYWSCALTYSGLANVPPVLVDGFGYASIISGRDDATAIKLVTLGQDRMAYIAPADASEYTDYRANTVGVRSVCENIDRWCITSQQNPSTSGASNAQCGKFVGLRYTSADEVFNGTTISNGVVGAITTYFTNQNWSNVLTVRNATNSFFTVTRLDSTVKPTFYGLPAHGSMSAASGTQFSSFVGCHTEFVNFTYTFANEAIVAADISPLEDKAVANAILAPAMMAWDPFLNSGAATTMTARSLETALQSWVDTLHMHYLPFAAIVMDPVDNIAEQTRHPTLVARIPKAPLFTLATLLVLSIVFNGFILVASLWNTSLAKSHRKQLTITVAGLAASRFEDDNVGLQSNIDSTWQLFAESDANVQSKRVGFSNVENERPQFVSFGKQIVRTDDSS